MNPTYMYPVPMPRYYWLDAHGIITCDCKESAILSSGVLLANHTETILDHARYHRRVVPFMPDRSCLLRRSVPALNLPMFGAPTPRARFSSGFLVFAALSRMMPFSLASCLLRASLSVALAVMPFRCDIGILSCLSIDVFEPSVCSRMSSSF